MIIFYFLILLLPLTTHPLWTRTIAGMTPIKALGLMIAAYALAYFFMRKDHPQLLGTWQARLYVLLCTIGAISLGIKVKDPGLLTNMVQIYVSLALLFFATVVLVDSLRRLRYVLLSMIASMSVASFICPAGVAGVPQRISRTASRWRLRRLQLLCGLRVNHPAHGLLLLAQHLSNMGPHVVLEFLRAEFVGDDAWGVSRRISRIVGRLAHDYLEVES